ncbi:DUF3854 domain-containing protein [Nostoc sp.]|uniref:DUF3854 domain-containing protein n=1 Tax=Nostoc sp. TaxID=1180 RepID=UPI002FFC569F
MIRHSVKTSESWQGLPWKKFRKTLFRLQKRVFKAVLVGDKRKARSLQKLILKSTSARFLAIRQVSKLYAGKKTAGIDGKKSLSFEERFELETLLAQDSSKWRHQGLREIPIPKKDGTTRMLKISTIADRAWQCLAKYALEPAHEATFHARSYGFRTGRSAHDAQQYIFNNLNSRVNGIEKRVIELDIEKCNDLINHSAIMDELISPKGLKLGIFRCLKAGVNPEFPEQGTPQGGVVSPLLANIALNGIESIHRYHLGYKEGGRITPKTSAVKIVEPSIRYADDMVIILRPEDNAIEILERISEFLRKRGMNVSQKKTKVTAATDGFDFLGWHFIPISEEDLKHPGGFWHWVWQHNIPVTIVEGVKKAGALLRAGYAAIAIPGVNAGYRTPHDEYGTAIGKPNLIPDLKHFATQGRQVNICFDQDNKPETIQRVRTAISRMGRLLVNEGCSLRVIDLPFGQEKGVDDFIVAKGQPAFDALYNTAVALELWEIKLFTLLTYPPAIALNQRFLGQLLVPEGEKLIILKAPKGTGKTEWLATEVAKAHHLGQRVLIITHCIQLGEALCNRFGVNYVTEVRTNETGTLLGYGVCVDSLHQESQARFNPNDWSNDVIIIDECDQVFWHLLNSGTEVQKRRVSVLKNLKQLVQNVLGSSQGKIYLSSADVSDTDVKYVLSLVGEYRVNPFVIVNNYRDSAGNCYNYSGSNPKNLIAALDKAISIGRHHLLCCSAQKALSKWGLRLNCLLSLAINI